jgi:hypothetical protein
MSCSSSPKERWPESMCSFGPTAIYVESSAQALSHQLMKLCNLQTSAPIPPHVFPLSPKSEGCGFYVLFCSKNNTCALHVSLYSKDYCTWPLCVQHLFENTCLVDFLSRYLEFVSLLRIREIKIRIQAPDKLWSRCEFETL